VQEATPVVDDNLLEAVTLVANSSGATGQPSIGKDIDIVRRVTTPPVAASLQELPIPKQYSVEGRTSLKVVAGRMSSVGSPIAILGVTRGKLAHFIALPITSFCLGSDTQGIITAAIQVMGSEYLAALKKVDLDAVEAKIQETPMMYKGIERLYGDPTPRGKRWRHSLCCHTKVVGQQKTAWAEEVELVQSHLAMVHTKVDALQERHRSIVLRSSDLEETLRGAREEECQLKRDVEPKSLKLQAVGLM